MNKGEILIRQQRGRNKEFKGGVIAINADGVSCNWCYTKKQVCLHSKHRNIGGNAT